MSFTDEEAKRLKEMCADRKGPKHTFWRGLKALLARLEAAERLLDASFNPEDIDPFDYEAWHKRFETWRKARGERAGRVQE